MKCIVRNLEQFRNCCSEIEYMLSQGKQVDLSYELAHKPKSLAQIGFLFAALINQCQKYLESFGFVVDSEDVRYYLYKKVAEIVPEIRSDCALFGVKGRIKHIPEYDKATMSKFIDGVFTVLETDPMFEGIILTADTYYNWVYHLTPEEIKSAQVAKLPERDNDYLVFVRTRPCIICGMQHAGHAHHLKDMRLCGLTQKAPDWATMPLCPKCHMTIAHGTGFKERMSWIPIDIIDFLRICYMRWRAKL